MRFGRRPHRVLCPICSTAREVSEFRFPRIKALSLTLGVAALFAAAGYLSFSPTVALWAGLLAGMLCFLSVEVYYSVQFRRELECPVCRFDPLLYRRAPEKAKEQCLDGLKRKEQVLAAKGQVFRPELERARELHG